MKSNKFYAVKRGVKPGIYLNWEDCSRQVIKFKGAIFKSFPTREEAQLFVAEAEALIAAPKSSSSKKRGVSIRKECSCCTDSSSAKRKVMSQSSEAKLAIYTDGACKGNNHVRFKQVPAGWGVVVVDEITRTRIVELYGPVVLDKASSSYMNAKVCSNNTAELTAIGEALLWLRDYGGAYPGVAIIRYDSEYAAKSIRGIFNGNKNTELIVYIRNLLREVQAKGRTLAWEHVKGHSGDEMNDRADYLAGVGASGRFCQTQGTRYSVNCSLRKNQKEKEDEIYSTAEAGPEMKKVRYRGNVVDLT